MSAAMQPSIWAPGINPSHRLANGLVCALPMWEGDGDKAMDYSGNGVDGTLTDMDPATDWVPSKTGSSLECDGSNDNLLVPVPDIHTTGSFAVVLRADTASQSNMHIISHTNATSTRLYLVHNVTAFEWGYGDDGAIISAGTPSTSAWQVVGATWDLNRTTFTAYIDGEQVGTDAAIAWTGTWSSAVFKLAEYAAAASNNWHGAFAGFAAWDRALTLGEMHQFYTEPYALYGKYGGLM